MLVLFIQGEVCQQDNNSVVLQLTHPVHKSLFNCELKPAHAFGVERRKSFKFRFTIG